MLINQLLERLNLVRRSTYDRRVAFLEEHNLFLETKLDQCEQDLLAARRRLQATQALLNLSDDQVLNPSPELPTEASI